MNFTSPFTSSFNRNARYDKRRVLDIRSDEDYSREIFSIVVGNLNPKLLPESQLVLTDGSSAYLLDSPPLTSSVYQMRPRFLQSGNFLGGALGLEMISKRSVKGGELQIYREFAVVKRVFPEKQVKKDWSYIKSWWASVSDTPPIRDPKDLELELERYLRQQYPKNFLTDSPQSTQGPVPQPGKR